MVLSFYEHTISNSIYVHMHNKVLDDPPTKIHLIAYTNYILGKKKQALIVLATSCACTVLRISAGCILGAPDNKVCSFIPFAL